ncbi:ribonuclease H [Prochlorococcus sp. MIT 1341]|uniref:ribonuclease H family protein n=1 Tax=Prochlorococcus sp. MIT 1341 TaxID=3096221 RepID=UPI002A74C759|nr:ribonuclease H [Prochlorococcus sp. MIT 1341]
MTDQPLGRVIAAATDGACSGNPGPGGWAVLFRFENGFLEEFGGHVRSTTNNRMELQAALEALKRLKQFSMHPDLQIRTDSKYLIDGFTKWITAWKKNGWRTSSGKAVLNKDLWLALDHARLQQVPFAYVKGHSGDKDNDRVDKIAVAFSKGLSIKLNTRTDHQDNSIPHESSLRDKAISDIAPMNLQKLLTRFELADHFANSGHTLSDGEIAQLIEEPIEKIRTITESWVWRDWVIEPLSNQKWRLRNNLENIISSEDRCND